MFRTAIATSRRGLKTLATNVSPAAFPTYYNASKPCLLDVSNFQKMPALKNWIDGSTNGLNTGHFEKIMETDGADPAVGVERGRLDRAAVESGESESDFQRFEMPFSFFLKCINHPEAPQFSDLYLAQTYLTETLPTLKDDLSPNPYLEGASLDAIGFWIGRNTYTPAHYDPSGNIYMVVFGSKKVRLWPPVQEQPVLGGKKAPGANFNFSAGKPEYEVELKAGQVLYTPQGWYHELESEGLSVAVNWWFRR